MNAEVPKNKKKKNKKERSFVKFHSRFPFTNLFFKRLVISKAEWDKLELRPGDSIWESWKIRLYEPRFWFMERKEFLIFNWPLAFQKPES